VATPEEHRGHGFGGAVTAHAVEAGRSEGARGAYLQSSPMGLPVYQRLGFVTVERWRQWMPSRYVT
jgi:GNAT superfamily N-acetyltransferase